MSKPSVTIGEIVSEAPRLQKSGFLYLGLTVFVAVECGFFAALSIYLLTEDSFPWNWAGIIFTVVTLPVALAVGLTYQTWHRSNLASGSERSDDKEVYITGRPMMSRVQFGVVGSIAVFSYQVAMFLTVNFSGYINFTEANHHAVRVPILLILQASSFFVIYFCATSINTLLNGMGTIQDSVLSKPYDQ